jgi:hypothetical protein
MIARRSLLLLVVAVVAVGLSVFVSRRGDGRGPKQIRGAHAPTIPELVEKGRPAPPPVQSVPRFTVDAGSQARDPKALKAVRAVRPQRDVSEELQARPPWPGPWPESARELDMTPEIAARVQEYGGRSAVDQMLRFLAGMRKCLARHHLERPGGVFLELSFSFDHTAGVVRGGEVGIEQSTVSPGDDLAILECARGTHTGVARRMSEATRAATAGSSGYVWRVMLNVPAENDAFYSWLLDGDAL